MLLNIRALSKSLQEKAEKELNEVPNQMLQNLNSLREWLEKQEHIKYRNDDQLLINFLRSSKFSLQRTKEKIDAFYTCRKLCPEIAAHMDLHLPPIQKYFETGTCLPLPIATEDPDGPRVLLLRHSEYDPDEITLYSMLKGAWIACDILLNDDDNFVVSGVKIIWDMKGAHLKTALQATPVLIKKGIFAYEKAFAARLKAIYVINIPKFGEQVLNLTKLLLSKKLADRTHFYSTNNWEAIFKDIPRSSFPIEYGGDGDHIAKIQAEWLKTAESHRERLLNEDNYCTDEAKRSSESNYVSSIFGLEGSFRKLEVD